MPPAAALRAALCAAAAAGGTAPSYRAAVVEMSPPPVPTDEVLSRGAALAMEMANLARMDAYMADAKAGGAQVVVFPEYGVVSRTTLRGNWSRGTILPFLEHVPAPPPAGAAVLNPCLDAAVNATAPVTAAVSCMARRHSLLTVVNLGDWRACDPSSNATGCPADGRLQFNTAIALGEDGALLARYHKYHLYNHEPRWFDVPAGPPTDGRFRASFGAEFGVFICFDMLFNKVPRDLAHFAFPTFWDNGVLGTTAIEAQTTFSLAHGALLAANIGYSKDSSGSGIYARGKRLATWYNPTAEPQEKMLIADVPCPECAPAAVKYGCLDGACVATAGGVDLPTCRSACAPPARP